MKEIQTTSLPCDLDEFDEIIDARCPDEFQEDHLPGAINLPVLTNKQRAEVGILYDQNSFKARKLGAAWISKNLAEHLARHFSKKAKSYTPLIYCWRGGMRSYSMATVLRLIGWHPHILTGGYKAFRKHVISETRRMLSQKKHYNFTLLEGPTGCAKTKLLQKLASLNAQVIDLEEMAKHSGSVLGEDPKAAQPSQKAFETNLWKKLSTFDPEKMIFAEAESNRIGALHCPADLWNKLAEAQVLSISLSLQKRVAFLMEDYAHLVDDEEKLKNILERLIKIRGHKQVQEWINLLENNKLVEFVTSILSRHYDLVYKRAGETNSNFKKPFAKIQLKDTTEMTLDKITNKILKISAS